MPIRSLCSRLIILGGVFLLLPATAQAKKPKYVLGSVTGGYVASQQAGERQTRETFTIKARAKGPRGVRHALGNDYLWIHMKGPVRGFHRDVGDYFCDYAYDAGVDAEAALKLDLDGSTPHLQLIADPGGPFGTGACGRTTPHLGSVNLHPEVDGERLRVRRTTRGKVRTLTIEGGYTHPDIGAELALRIVVTLRRVR